MKPTTKLSRRVIILLIFTLITVCFVCMTAYSKYIFAHDYYFFVETPCDVTNKTCYVRDCDDYCPPNKLEEFTVFRVSAADFSQCVSNSCTQYCATQKNCQEVLCDSDPENECSE